MDRANQPTEVHFVHDVAHGLEGFGNGWLIVKGHSKPSGELDQEADQRHSTQTIKDIDMGWNVLAADIICESLDLQPLVKPLEWLRVGHLLSEHEARIPKKVLLFIKNVTQTQCRFLVKPESWDHPLGGNKIELEFSRIAAKLYLNVAFPGRKFLS